MPERKPANEKILVLILGGTINGDWEKTEKINDNPQKPMTHVEPYRDLSGRQPVQIYIEDVLKLDNVTFKEISDKDSKDLTPAEYQQATDAILTSLADGYSKVLYVMGTDMAIPAGRMLEYACLPHPSVPVVFVTAMKEMTWDMDKDAGLFITHATDGIQSLKRAIGAVLKPGVYIWADNIRDYADPLDTHKDFAGKRFVAKIKSLTL